MTITQTRAPDQEEAVWNGIFAPLHAEHDYVVDELEGRLPEVPLSFHGTFTRRVASP